MPASISSLHFFDVFGAGAYAASTFRMMPMCCSISSWYEAARDTFSAISLAEVSNACFALDQFSSTSLSFSVDGWKALH